MSFWAQYKTDEKAQQQGIWREFKGGLSLKIARADLDSNPEYAQAYQVILSKVDQSDAEQSAKAMRELYATAIVKNAKVSGKNGYCDPEGNPVEFSQEFTYNMFKELPELLKEVIQIANNVDHYLEMTTKAGEQLGKS